MWMLLPPSQLIIGDEPAQARQANKCSHVAMGANIELHMPIGTPHVVAMALQIGP